MVATPLYVANYSNVLPSPQMMSVKIIQQTLSRWKHSADGIKLAIKSETCARPFVRSYSSAIPCQVPEVSIPFDFGWPPLQSSRPYSSTLHDVSRIPNRTEEQSLHYISRTSPSKVRLIMDFFDINEGMASHLIKKNAKLKNCDPHNLLRAVNILKEYKVSPEDVMKNKELLWRRIISLEHQVAILNEMGLINLEASHYVKFAGIFKTSIKDLKAQQLIPNEYNPRVIALSKVGLSQDDIAQISVDLPSDVNNLLLKTVHIKLSQAYMSWRLQCDAKVIEKLLRVYPDVKTKSMKLQHMVIQRLNDDWGCSNEKIVRNGKFLVCSPYNIDLIASEVKQLAGKDVKPLVHTAPRILTMPYQVLLRIDSLFEEMGIDISSMDVFPRMYTLNPDTIENRLLHLKQNPEYSHFLYHPRIQSLIYHNRVAMTRLAFASKAKDLNLTPSLNFLCEASKNFSRPLVVHSLKVEEHNREIISYIAEHFSMENDDVMAEVNVIFPLEYCGQRVTIATVKKNLTHLSKEGYNRQQVFKALEVLMYPPNQLVNHLKNLSQRPEFQPFSEIRTNPDVLQLLASLIKSETSS